MMFWIAWIGVIILSVTMSGFLVVWGGLNLIIPFLIVISAARARWIQSALWLIGLGLTLFFINMPFIVVATIPLIAVVARFIHARAVDESSSLVVLAIAMLFVPPLLLAGIESWASISGSLGPIIAIGLVERFVAARHKRSILMYGGTR